MQKTAIWEDAEVSTRNCFNCIVEGRKVKCRFGFSMKLRNKDKGDNHYLFHNVINKPHLLGWCEGCQDFDNDWNNGNKPQ